MKKIRAAVVGYGNIGKYAVEALEAAEDFEIAGAAADGAEAVKAVLELRPDVVLMDVTMPGMNGIGNPRHSYA